mgnify:CR=1 FL=1
MTDTDTLIKNKDIAVDSGGRYIHISGDDEILQQAFFKISAKFAGFVYNRELGCELNKVNFDDENFQEKVNSYNVAGTGGFSDSYCESFGFEKTEIQYQTDLQRKRKRGDY